MAENQLEAEVLQLSVENMAAKVLDKCSCCYMTDAGSLVVVRNGIDTLLSIRLVVRCQQKNIQLTGSKANNW